MQKPKTEQAEMRDEKPLPIGVENFDDMIRAGYYYIDKTSFIKELLDLKGKVNLFTRPRRFGKNLNLSMHFGALKFLSKCRYEATGKKTGQKGKGQLWAGRKGKDQLWAGQKGEEQLWTEHESFLLESKILKKFAQKDFITSIKPV